MISSSSVSIDRLRSRSNRIFAAVFMIIGAFFLCLVVVQLASTASLFARTRSATGFYVASVEKVRGVNGGSYLFARFRFRAADGTTYYATSSAGSTRNGYTEGDQVSIRYDPDAPVHAVICSFWTLWIGPLVCGVFATAFGLPGLVVMMKQCKSGFVLQQ